MNAHVQLPQPYGYISYPSKIAINLKSNPTHKHALLTLEKKKVV